MTDTDYMQAALALARRGIFSTSPNPRVGCVIVKNDIIIGRGFHERAGEAHAEVNALRDAGIENVRGATAYVTLEPCAHFGRTPPCADALVKARLARVVIACTDPNPLVAGKGIAKLKAANIAVTVGVCETEALTLNRAFFHHIKTQLPYITLKLAASLDGRTALASGESQWITGEAARQDVHFHRLASDAVMAGTGSVIHDNARLNARFKTDLASKQPLRIVIDSELQTPNTAAIFQIASPVMLATSENAHEIQPYPNFVEILRLPTGKNGKLDLRALFQELGKRGIQSVFIEAGAQLAGAILDQQLADAILLYLAPTFLGADAKPLATIKPLAHLSDKIRYKIADSSAIGDDWRFRLVKVE